jgi:hypothetical protein
MIKMPCWVTLLLSTTFPLNAHAIKLDCVDHGDGTYTCVEIGHSPTASLSDAKPGQDTRIEPAYLEQAKKACTQHKPRKRIGGQKTGAALRMEEEKSARESYDRCLLETAAKIRKDEKQ